MLEKLWDDVVAGPQPDRGLDRLRKITTTPLAVKGFFFSLKISHLLYFSIFFSKDYQKIYMFFSQFLIMCDCYCYWVEGGEAESSSGKFQRSLSMPASPGAPSTPVTPTTPLSARKDNVWRSVFHPGSNLATRGIGAEVFDKPTHPNSPTVYDW